MSESRLVLSVKKRTPWYGKVAAKLILARLPIDGRTWHRLGIFQTGTMDDPRYALSVFKRHFDRAPLAGRGVEFTALELGPGRSLLSGLIAYAHGARQTYLVDVEGLSTRSTQVYVDAIRILGEAGLRVPSVGPTLELDTLLDESGTRYATQGLESLRAIPSDSVDFSWSQAVLEHIRRDQFEPTMEELYRIMKRGAISSHTVDFRDHLGDALNNLRFPDWIWESDFMAASGFYTNRLRPSEIVKLCANVGFHIELATVSRWPMIPTPRDRMTPWFRSFEDDDLLICGFDVVLRKP